MLLLGCGVSMLLTLRVNRQPELFLKKHKISRIRYKCIRVMFYVNYLGLTAINVQEKDYQIGQEQKGLFSKYTSTTILATVFKVLARIVD